MLLLSRSGGLLEAQTQRSYDKTDILIAAIQKNKLEPNYKQHQQPKLQNSYILD